MVKVRIGKSGKPTDFGNPLLNVKAHFGSFALLLNSKREVIPLSFSGEPVEPLKENELYTIELPSQRDIKQIEKAKSESKKLFKQKQDEKLKAIIIENDPFNTLDHTALLKEIDEIKKERLKIAKKQKKKVHTNIFIIISFECSEEAEGIGGS
jgi:hypothetical protein